MLHLMNDITDKPNWASDLLGPDSTNVVAEWADEALHLPFISQCTWDWCVPELHDKARFAEETGLVFVLNGGARICKSDTVLTLDVLGRLAAGVEQLAACRRPVGQDQGKNNMPGLVDPNWLPFVYGKTPLSLSGAVVGLQDAVESMGRGTVVPPDTESWERDALRIRIDAPRVVRGRRLALLRNRRAYHFSPRFQWLPCEVLFEAAGGWEDPAGTRGARSGQGGPAGMRITLVHH